MDFRAEEKELDAAVVRTLLDGGTNSEFLLLVEAELGYLLERPLAGLKFPSGLSSWQRMLIHKTCERFGLESSSSGAGPTRQTTVYKTATSKAPAVSYHELLGVPPLVLQQSTTAEGPEDVAEDLAALCLGSSGESSSSQSTQQQHAVSAVGRGQKYIPPHRQKQLKGVQPEDASACKSESQGDTSKPGCILPVVSDFSKFMGSHSPVQQEDRPDVQRSVAAKVSNDNVLEIYNFPSTTSTADLEEWLTALAGSRSAYFIKWVDDTHALAIFNSINLAQKAYAENAHSSFQLRPIQHGSEKAKRKCGISVFPLQTSLQRRPQTTTQVARRLILGSLAITERQVENVRKDGLQPKPAGGCGVQQKPEKKCKGRGFKNCSKSKQAPNLHSGVSSNEKTRKGRGFQPRAAGS